MPKMKTNRAAAKRFKRTGTGKLRRNHSYKNHKLTSKTRTRKRKLGKPADVHASDVKRVSRMIQG
jgi:large subunit ribosomal protein L35